MNKLIPFAIVIIMYALGAFLYIYVKDDPYSIHWLIGGLFVFIVCALGLLKIIKDEK